jgi:hypothetical protein
MNFHASAEPKSLYRTPHRKSFHGAFICLTFAESVSTLSPSIDYRSPVATCSSRCESASELNATLNTLKNRACIAFLCRMPVTQQIPQANLPIDCSFA